MLENGTITTDEALTLLENLGESQVENKEELSKPNLEKTQPVAEEKSAEQEKPTEQKHTESESVDDKEPEMEEFLEDLRKDFTNVGDRFMQFMQGAVQKVKAFDFESPFGHFKYFNRHFHTVCNNNRWCR